MVRHILCAVLFVAPILLIATPVTGEQSGTIAFSTQGLAMSPSSPVEGGDVTFTLSLQNVDNIIAEDVVVEFHKNNYQSGEPAALYSVDIVANEFEDIDFVWANLDWGDGEQTRDYQYIDDAIDGYLLSESLPAGEIVNTGFGVDHKIIDIGKAIIDICGSKSNIVFADPRPGEVHKLRSNIDKLKSYGFVPENSLREGLQKYIDWLQKYDLDSLGVMK